MSMVFHLQMDIQTEWMNNSMQLYVQVFIHHQREDPVKLLSLVEFAVNNQTAEWKKRTSFFAVQGMNHRELFVGKPTKVRNQRSLVGDQLQATMEEIDEHLRVEMRCSQTFREKGANREWYLAPNIRVQFLVALGDWHVRTMRPSCMLDWK